MKVTVGFDWQALTRREFLGTALRGGAALVGTSLLPLNSALAQARLNIGTIKIGDLSPFFLALERGFFKDAGLEINATAMVGGAAIAPALASGALNIGWSNVVSIVQGHQAGFDYRFIANGAVNKRDTHEVFGFQVAVDSPIRSAKELEEKTCASNTLRNIIHVSGLHWIDNNGGDSSKVKWVEIPFPQMEPALVTNHIDAFLAVEPFVTVPSKIHKKTKILGYPLGGIAPRLLIASYFSSEAWIEKNVEVVQAFIGAINRGIDAHNADHEQAKATIAKHTGLKQEYLKEMTLPAFEKKILASDLQPMIDVSYAYKLIDNKPMPRDIISKVAPV